MDAEKMKAVIEVENLIQKSGKEIFLNGLSFCLNHGECLGIFGLRGSGKTALLHIIAGADRFTSGKVTVLGCDIRKSQKYKKRIGLVTQQKSLFQDLRAGENLDFIATLKDADTKDIDRVINALELREYLHQPVGNLDPGVYQRLSLACALLGSPRLLIADEAIKDIDLYSRRIILREAKEFLAGGGSCICSFSNMEYSEYMDRVGWLENGNITIYTPDEARNKWNQLLHSVPGQSGEQNV